MLCLTAKPNKAHYKLAEMERAGILSSVITQNIDGLHTAAGSKRCWSFTEAYTATTAWTAENSTPRRIF